MEHETRGTEQRARAELGAFRAVHLALRALMVARPMCGGGGAEASGWAEARAFPGAGQARVTRPRRRRRGTEAFERTGELRRSM